MPNGTVSYPATLTIDYPDRPLNRLTSFFRLIVAIPILIIVVLLVGINNAGSRECPGSFTVPTVGYVFLPLILMLLFRKKYPRWWFDWNLALMRFSMRVGAYLFLLRDEYPSTDQDQAVHLDLIYPNAQELSRWLPLVKWFLAIPHLVILIFLGIAAIVCVIISWFAILFTGRYPRSLFDFVVGVNRWGLRVNAYCFLLTTDRYPPFTLAA
jgi:hypothetical protein